MLATTHTHTTKKAPEGTEEKPREELLGALERDRMSGKDSFSREGRKKEKERKRKKEKEKERERKKKREREKEKEKKRKRKKKEREKRREGSFSLCLIFKWSLQGTSQLWVW